MIRDKLSTGMHERAASRWTEHTTLWTTFQEPLGHGSVMDVARKARLLSALRESEKKGQEPFIVKATQFLFDPLE